MLIIDAARQLGSDRVLNDPTDDEIVLASVELARGNWPCDLYIDRYTRDVIVNAYDVEDRKPCGIV